MGRPSYRRRDRRLQTCMAMDDKSSLMLLPAFSRAAFRSTRPHAQPPCGLELEDRTGLLMTVAVLPWQQGASIGCPRLDLMECCSCIIIRLFHASSLKVRLVE